MDVTVWRMMSRKSVAALLLVIATTAVAHAFNPHSAIVIIDQSGVDIPLEGLLSPESVQTHHNQHIAWLLQTMALSKRLPAAEVLWQQWRQPDANHQQLSIKVAKLLVAVRNA